MKSQAVVESEPRCPFCAGAYGMPHAVTMRNWERFVEYECRACKKTWTETELDRDSRLAV